MDELLTKDDLSNYLPKLQHLQKVCLGREGYMSVYIDGLSLTFELFSKTNELLLSFVLEVNYTTKAGAEMNYNSLLAILQKEGWL